LPHPKTGKSTPYDDPLPPPPNHYQSKAHRDAKKASQNSQKPAKARRQSAKSRDGPATVAEAMLYDMGYKDYTDMLRDIPEAAPEDMVLAAITKMGATKGEEDE
jgi:hypothetical protein